jgi:hypothetical protein
MNAAGGRLIHRTDARALLAVTDRLAEIERAHETDHDTCEGMDHETADLYLHYRRKGMPAGDETLGNAMACIAYRRLGLSIGDRL